MAEDLFWALSHLSNEQLLTALRDALRTKRRALAEIIAHLAEVEERRLHLQAACSSLFYYCARRLHMSEDEACRRIELTRLARRFPALFEELASGHVSLSVALLRNPVLSVDNHVELLAAVRGASLQQARGLLAIRFPKPDVPTQIRKLPERRPRAAEHARPVEERSSQETPPHEAPHEPAPYHATSMPPHEASHEPAPSNEASHEPAPPHQTSVQSVQPPHLHPLSAARAGRRSTWSHLAHLRNASSRCPQGAIAFNSLPMPLSNTSSSERGTSCATPTPRVS